MAILDGALGALGLQKPVSAFATAGSRRNRNGKYGARKSDPRGFPLLSRDGRLATKIFGTDQPRLNLLPAQRFLFYVRFVRPQGVALTAASNQGSLMDWSKGLGFALKTIDRPTVSFNTQTLNQYNKKRQIQTRVEYEPISMVFHDTYDLKIQNMFNEYFMYYYGDGRKSNGAWNYDVTNKEFMNAPWGFTLNHIGNPQETNFFSHIEVYQFFAKQYTRMDIINPKIMAFDPSSLSYEEGQITQEVSMRIAFEGIVHHNEGKYIDLTDGLLELSGLSKADYYETEFGPVAAGSFQNVWVDNPAPAQPDIFGNLSKNITDTLLSGKPVTSKTIRNSVLNSVGKFSFGPGGMSGGTNTAGSILTGTTDNLTHDRGTSQIVGGVLSSTGLSSVAGLAASGNYSSVAALAAMSGLSSIVAGGVSSAQVGSRAPDTTLDPFTRSVNTENKP